MRQLGVRIFNAALAAFCCFQVATVANRILSQELAPQEQYDTGPAPVPPPRSTQWAERQAILDRNLFGAELTAENVPEPVVEEDVEETKLPLKLEGTIAGKGNFGPRAAILDTQNRSSEVVTIGDDLENHAGVTIAAIERGRVLLVNQGRREELLLDEGPPPPPPPAFSRAGRQRVQQPDDRARRPRRFSRRRAPQRAGPARGLGPQLDPETAEKLSQLSDRVEAGELSLDEIEAEVQKLTEEQAAQGAGAQEPQEDLAEQD